MRIDCNRSNCRHRPIGVAVAALRDVATLKFLLEKRNELLCLLGRVKANHKIGISAATRARIIGASDYDRRYATTNIHNPKVIAAIFIDATTIEALRLLYKLYRLNDVIVCLTTRARNATSAAKATLIARTRTIINAKSNIISTNRHGTCTKYNDKANNKSNETFNGGFVKWDTFNENDIPASHTGRDAKKGNERIDLLIAIQTATSWCSFHSDFKTELIINIP